MNLIYSTLECIPMPVVPIVQGALLHDVHDWKHRVICVVANSKLNRPVSERRIDVLRARG